MNSKTWIGILVAVIVVVGLIAMKGKKPSEVADVNGDGVITVGAVLPLTGPTAQFGEIYKNGIEHGLAGDPRIKVIYEDSKGEAQGATAAFQKVTSIDNADIVISALSKPSVPLAPIAQANKVPLLVSLVAGINMTSVENDYVYRLFWNTDMLSDLFVQRIQSQGFKKISLLQAKNEASQNVADNVLPKLKEAGIEVVYEIFQDSDTDFRTQLTKIHGAKTEAFAVLGVPAAQWKNILTQADDIGIKLPTYDIFGVFLNPGTSESLGDLAEGVYTITTPFNLGQYKSETRTKIISELGREPGGFESYGFDTAALLRELADNNATTRESIRSYLSGLKSYEGVTAPYSIDERHNITPTPIQARFEKGLIVQSDK